MLQKVLITLLVLAPATAFARTCPTPVGCIGFSQKEDACAKRERKCPAFLSAYKKMIETYDCKRPGDTEPVPAVWLCANHESSVDLLKSLKSKSARNFYKSAKFQATIDSSTVKTAPTSENPKTDTPPSESAPSETPEAAPAEAPQT